MYLVFGDVPWVAGLFYGIKPCATVIVLQAALRIGARTLGTSALWSTAVASFVATFVFDVSFPGALVVTAALGYFGRRWKPDQFRISNKRQKDDKSCGSALIDDDTPAPAHALFSWRRAARVGLLGIFFLWVLPMGWLTVTFGWHQDLTRMGRFFTKAALVKFGGAYAVLPYVHQGAVDLYGWLTSTQMVDGLALDETTPGPLIMVVALVGFVGGYLRALLGADSLFLSGALAALVVTWFTFLPSLVLILGGL